VTGTCSLAAATVASSVCGGRGGEKWEKGARGGEQAPLGEDGGEEKEDIWECLDNV